MSWMWWLDVHTRVLGLWFVVVVVVVTYLLCLLLLWVM